MDRQSPTFRVKKQYNYFSEIAIGHKQFKGVSPAEKAEKSMKAIIFEEHGSVKKLKYRTVPKPRAESGMAVVRVRAVALNGFDAMILRKIPGLKTPLPMIPGGDVSGEVVELPFGADGIEISVGDRVMVDPSMPDHGGVLGETIPGGACEFLVVPIENLVLIPNGVTFEDAASLPIAYGSAHRMMITRGNVGQGDKVLILGASGGVGTCCLQLAKMMGAEVAVCTRSVEKGAALRELGADHVINTGLDDFVHKIHKIWGKPKVFGDGGGADIVINFNGGESWAKSFRTVRRGGKLLICGATNGYQPQTDLRYIWSLEINIIGSNCWTRTDLTTLLTLVSEGRIKPVISSVRPLEDLPKSLQELIDRKVIGKAVLKPL